MCDSDASGKVVTLVCVSLAVALVVCRFLRFRPDRKINCVVRLYLRLASLYTQISLRAKCARSRHEPWGRPYVLSPLLASHVAGSSSAWAFTRLPAELTLLAKTCSPWRPSHDNTEQPMPCSSQIATRVPDVFMVPFPSSAQSLLSIFEVFNLNISGLSLPLSCIGLGTYWERLFFTLVFPLVIAAGITVCSLVFAMCKTVRKGGMPAVAKEGAIQALEDGRKSPLRVAGLTALPHLLKLSFLMFPMVTPPLGQTDGPRYI